MRRGRPRRRREGTTRASTAFCFFRKGIEREKKGEKGKLEWEEDLGSLFYFCVSLFFILLPRLHFSPPPPCPIPQTKCFWPSSSPSRSTPRSSPSSPSATSPRPRSPSRRPRPRSRGCSSGRARAAYFEKSCLESGARFIFFFLFLPVSVPRASSRSSPPRHGELRVSVSGAKAERKEKACARREL